MSLRGHALEAPVSGGADVAPDHRRTPAVVTSALRLVSAVAMEINEEWETNRKYLTMEPE